MKITLSNLHEATEQQVFNQVAKHLLEQAQKSLDNENSICAYRGAEGLKCAAGCLISDEEYRPKWELKDWETLVETGDIKTTAHRNLILNLQKIHDDRQPYVWIKYLEDLAQSMGLDSSILN